MCGYEGVVRGRVEGLGERRERANAEGVGLGDGERAAGLPGRRRGDMEEEVVVVVEEEEKEEEEEEAEVVM